MTSPGPYDAQPDPPNRIIQIAMRFVEVSLILLLLLALFVRAEPPTRQGVSGANRCVTGVCADLISVCADQTGEARQSCMCTQEFAQTLNNCNKVCSPYAGSNALEEYRKLCAGNPLARLDLLTSSAVQLGVGLFLIAFLL